MASGQEKKNLSVGSIVEIVEMHNQKTGELTEGVVQRFLTKSPSHPRGIKVQLKTGEIGRVQNVVLK